MRAVRSTGEDARENVNSVRSAAAASGEPTVGANIRRR